MQAEVEMKAKSTPLTSVDENTLSFSIDDIKHPSETYTSSSSISTPTVSITTATEATHDDNSMATTKDSTINKSDKNNEEINAEHSHFSIKPTLERVSEKHEESPTVTPSVMPSDNVLQ